MTLKVRMYDYYATGEGRTISILIMKNATDLEIEKRFSDVAGAYLNHNAETFDFSYEHKNFAVINTLLPDIVKKTIDDITHDLSSAPGNFAYFSQYHINFG